MEIKITDSSPENRNVTVIDDTVITATDAAFLWYRAMLGYGYQPDSVLAALENVLEEYNESDP